MTAPATGIGLALVLATLGGHLALRAETTAPSFHTNSPMATARLGHTSTLLPNGQVLVAGGYGSNVLAATELYDPSTGVWRQTGPLNTGRYYHAATLLSNGKVLVAGGYTDDSSDPLSSAEVYDPATGMWSNTGEMEAGHVYHTTTLLTNGLVLVTGGINAVAELYDPGHDTWITTTPMNRVRWFHTATLLTNGTVLVAGGDYNGLATSEIYDPIAETWTTNAMAAFRKSHTSTLLPNGTVLAAGGWITVQIATNPPAYTSVSLASAELFDPATRQWTPTTNSMSDGRNDHSASLLPNGQVLLTGGFQNGPGSITSLELFDPITSAWIPVTNRLNHARSHHTATLLHSGRILVAGGLDRSALDSSELAELPLGFWSTNYPITTGRLNHTLTLLANGKALVAGGYNGSARSSAHIYDSVTGTWTSTGPLRTARQYHTATLLGNGKVLVAGGYNVSESESHLSSAELYDPGARTWTYTASMKIGRSRHSATLLSNGKVLVAGGADNTDHSLSTCEIYDPTARIWAATGPLTTARHEHTATLLPNGKVLVTGGYQYWTGGTLAGAELYDPASGLWSRIASMSQRRLWQTATLLANGKVLVTGGQGVPGDVFHASAELYDPASETWTITASMITRRGGHTATLLPNGAVLIAGGEHYQDGFMSLSMAELYDPVTARWVPTSPLKVARTGARAVLMPNGTVLVAAGWDRAYLDGTESYDVGLGFSNSWQPRITVATSPLVPGDELTLTGSGFRGISGASTGNGSDASSDHPVVQLRILENGQTLFLTASYWSDTSFVAAPVWGLPPGWAMVTAFVNGIPGAAQLVNIPVPVPALPIQLKPELLPNGSFRFTFTNSPGAIFGGLMTTNIARPLSNWTSVAGVSEVAPGRFEFTAPSTNSAGTFYTIRTP